MKKNSIPEFQTIKKDYYPEYWAREFKRIIKYAKMRKKELGGYYPDCISVELCEYIGKGVK